MATHSNLEMVVCPCCANTAYEGFARERGYNLVRCTTCRLLYVNPRPPLDLIDEGVRLGEHQIDGRSVDVKSRRVSGKVESNRRLLSKIYGPNLERDRPITWVDFGAGYGEFIEAVGCLAFTGSEVIGVEPMVHKAHEARRLGLHVVEGYPQRGQFSADFISMINIFSHIPDFSDFIAMAATNLRPDGELLIETGNLADLDYRDEFFNILDLPDHLVFAGESQIARYLSAHGFEIISIERIQVDGAINFVKTLVERAIGRPVSISLPYRSKYRQLVIRARREG